jgi:hypothetical protein
MKNVDMDQVYSLTTGRFIEQAYSVENVFISQLINLALDCANRLQVVSFIFKDKVSNRGEVQQRGVSAADKSVLDICKLTPLVNPQYKTLMNEVASYRSTSLGFEQQRPGFYTHNAEMLMIDYLLSSCMCYVEVFNGTNVDKFYATRNRFIAGGTASISEEETRQYTSYLQTTTSDYEARQLKVLKLGPLKGGYKITRPRSYVDFTKNVKVTPVFLLSAFVDGLSSTLQNNIVKLKFIKDNLQEREFITTTSPQILAQYYDPNTIVKTLSNVGTQLNRGYVRLPELGASKYDASGVRAITISRLTSIEIVKEFDASFIDVDFSLILPTFKSTIENLRNPRLLTMIHEDLVGQPPNVHSVMELQNTLTAFVDSQYAIATTTAQRMIHKYMVARKQIFTTYHDGKPVQYGSSSSGFNLGVEG